MKKALPLTLMVAAACCSANPTIRIVPGASRIDVYGSNNTSSRFKCLIVFGWTYAGASREQRSTNTVDVPANWSGNLVQISGAYVNIRTTTGLESRCNKVGRIAQPTTPPPPKGYVTVGPSLGCRRLNASTTECKLDAASFRQYRIRVWSDADSETNQRPWMQTEIVQQPVPKSDSNPIYRTKRIEWKDGRSRQEFEVILDTDDYKNYTITVIQRNRFSIARGVWVKGFGSK